MPVSVVSGSVGIMTALKDAVTRPAVRINHFETNESCNTVQSQLACSTKCVLLTNIDYEEIGYCNQKILDVWKTKYTILKPVLSEKYVLSVNIADSIYELNRKHMCLSISGEKDQLPKPKKILYPRQNIQIGWQSSGKKWQVGAGMINVGNTCYLNSTLQALFHVPAMANWLMSDVIHREKCEDDNGSTGGCIICAMAKTLISSQTNQSPIRPYLVYTKLRLVCKHLIMGRQEDAHEFLRYLVEAMEKSYLARIPNSKEFDQYSKETTPLNQILGGYLKSAVRCLACGHVSTTFQHFQDILLDIRKANSIEEALDVYFARERLEDMGYKCEACKKKVSATKQFSLERAPISLCIQLKRFSMIGVKLNKHVTIRPRLDLSPYAGKKCKENLSYKLVAMVTHLGASQHCGHYTAIGLTETGAYYQFDDSSVRPISLQNVVNTNAYIIFYELDNKDINRYSHPLINYEQVNILKQSTKSLYTTNNDNEVHELSSTLSSKMKTVEVILEDQSIGMASRQNTNDIDLTLLTISTNKQKNAITCQGERKQEKNTKKSTMQNSGKLEVGSLNGRIISRETESHLNSQSSVIFESDNSQILYSNKSNNSSTKVPHDETNGKTNSLCCEEKKSEFAFLTDILTERNKSDQLNTNQAEINENSKPDNNEYLKVCSESNDVLNQNIAQSPKTNVQSLVPYESDDGSELSIASFKSLRNYYNSRNKTISSPCFPGEYNSQLPKIRQNIPLPPVLKTKAGFWQVTDIEDNQYSKDENSQKILTMNSNSKVSHLSPADTLPKSKSNENDLNNRKKDIDTIHQLLKSSHQGLRRPVFTWWEQKPATAKQVYQLKQGRNRNSYEDEENLLEYGRQKKRKLNDSFVGQGNPGYNPFQEYQNNTSHYRRWNNIHRRYRQNHSHRNNFHRKSFNKKRTHRRRSRPDVNKYRHRHND